MLRWIFGPRDCREAAAVQSYLLRLNAERIDQIRELENEVEMLRRQVDEIGYRLIPDYHPKIKRKDRKR